jgi:hypothetical protein
MPVVLSSVTTQYFIAYNAITTPIDYWLQREAIYIIEIINNTRGGIVILIQSKKGNAAIGGKKLKC